MLLGNLLDISELRKLIASGHIRQQNHPTLPLAILNYSNECMFDDYWPETVQHCRGLIVELAEYSKEIIPESEIISRPFHKFFNLNHANQLEYQEANLPPVIPTVTEKMDGWFGSMWHYKGVYGVASRGSFISPGAEFGTNKIQKLVKYGAVDEFPKGYTPIFEIIFKAGKIVVDYPFEGLVLLALVNIETGEELPYDELQAVWAKIAGYSADNRPWIRLVKAHRMTLQECLTYDSSVIDLIRYAKRSHALPKGYSANPASEDTARNSDGSSKNKEGFVLSYPRPGTYPIKVKVKLEEYKRLHKLITGVTPQQIWKTLHNPMAPWLDAEVPDHFRKWALDLRDDLYSKFHAELLKAQEALKITDIGSMHGYIDDVEFRKVVFLALQETSPANAAIAISLYDGKIFDAYQAIWNRIRPVGRESETFYREGQGE